MRQVRSFALFTALILVSVLNSVSFAQTRSNNSGNGGINTIRGQIYSAAGTRADGQITVRLQSMSLGGDLTLQTDQGGGFEFHSLSPGTYTVVVDAGANFEIFRESVTIDPTVQIDPNVRVPPTPKSYNVPVYLRLKQNQTEKASVINAKLAQVPKEALKHYEKGLELEQGGKTDAALTEFKQATAIDPSFSAAHLEMGKLYLRAAHMDEAIAALGMAIKYEPNDFDATLDYGIALYGKNDFAAAEAEFNKAATLNAAAVTPHYYLGLLFIQTKQLEKAQAELENAKHLKGDKNFPLLHRYLGWVYMSRKMNREAVAEFEIYLKLDPKVRDADRFRQTIADLKSKIN